MVDKEDSEDFRDLVILPELVCANQLGILWCNRGDMERAKLRLNKALGTFAEYKEQDHGKSKIHNVNDLLCPEFASPGGPEQESRVQTI